MVLPYEHWDEFDLIDMSLSGKRGQCKRTCKLPSERKAGVANLSSKRGQCKLACILPSRRVKKNGIASGRMLRTRRSSIPLLW